MWRTFRSVVTRAFGAGAKSSRELVRAQYTCDECGAIAATVWCVPTGASLPDSDEGPGRDNRLVVDGFLGRLSVLIDKRPGRVWEAVEAADPEALWNQDPLWAPFFCPSCQRSYCQEHWSCEVEYADDYPGWYEHTIGRCPQGHQRMLDD